MLLGSGRGFGCRCVGISGGCGRLDLFVSGCGFGWVCMSTWGEGYEVQWSDPASAKFEIENLKSVAKNGAVTKVVTQY